MCTRRLALLAVPEEQVALQRCYCATPSRMSRSTREPAEEPVRLLQLQSAWHLLHLRGEPAQRWRTDGWPTAGHDPAGKRSLWGYTPGQQPGISPPCAHLAVAQRRQSHRYHKLLVRHTPLLAKSRWRVAGHRPLGPRSCLRGCGTAPATGAAGKTSAAPTAGYQATEVATSGLRLQPAQGHLLGQNRVADFAHFQAGYIRRARCWGRSHGSAAWRSPHQG